MNGREPVDALHRSTLHGERVAHPDRLLPFRPLDPSNRPYPFKTYAGADVSLLPRRLRRSSLPAVDVLSGRRAEHRELDDDLLGTLLFLAAGVNRVTGSAGGDPIWFRTAMSAGNLHPVEVYVLSGDAVYHYQPLDHALVPLRRDQDMGEGFTLVLTGIPFRTSWKYGERGWRHLWWDAGTLLANLLAAADAHGVPTQVITGFPDTDVAALVGIDGIDEMPLALVHLGDAQLQLPSADGLDPPDVQAGPAAPHVLRFPLVLEAQAGTALDAADVATWLQAADAFSLPAPTKVAVPAGPSVDPADRIEDVILRRGSTRMFHREPAPAPLLEWALAAAARATRLDAAAGGTLLEHLVNVHDVDGTEPGGYRYTADGGLKGHIPGNEARAVGTHLCLDQPLGGDSAYTVFHAAALDRLLDNLGGRGYRAAHVEAGIVAGRLALNSFALAAGATGLTFYDGEVSRRFGPDVAPLLATAVGLPATTPAPGGTPGAPAELGGYGRIMTRLAASLRRRRT